MHKGVAHVISGPPSTCLSTGQLIFHGLLQAFFYLSVPFGVIYAIPHMRAYKEGPPPAPEEENGEDAEVADPDPKVVC